VFMPNNRVLQLMWTGPSNAVRAQVEQTMSRRGSAITAMPPLARTRITLSPARLVWAGT